MECCIWCALCARFLCGCVVRSVLEFYSLTAFTWCTKQHQFSYIFSLIYWKIFSPFYSFLFHNTKNRLLCSLYVSGFSLLSLTLSLIFSVFSFQQEQLFRCVFCFYHFPEIFFSFFLYFPKKYLLSLQRRKTVENNFPIVKFSNFLGQFQVFRNYVW